MDITRFINSLENTVSNLEQCLKKWSTFDDDLKENYIDSIEWLLSEVAPMYAKASAHEAVKIAIAYRSILSYRNELLAIHVGVYPLRVLTLVVCVKERFKK